MKPTRFITAVVIACVVAMAGTGAQTLAAVKAPTGARLIDGTDRAPIADATIDVRGGLIVAAGPSSSVQVPAGAERVALNGETVIPELINAHGHVNAPDRDLQTYAKRAMRVASHLFCLQDAKGLLEAGSDFIAHSIRDTAVTPELIGL